MMQIAIIDDVGFGSGKSGLFGKELYVELLAKVNKEFLGNEVLRVTLGGVVKGVKGFTVRGSGARVLRIVYDPGLEEGLYRLLRRSGVDVIHANIINPRYPRHVVKVSKRLGIPIVTTVHSWAYVCPSGWAVRLPEQVPCSAGVQPHCVKCLYSLAELYKLNKALKVLDAFNQYEALKHLLRNSKAVISPSRLLTDAIRRSTGISNVYTIPNPIREDLLRLKPSYTRERAVAFYARLSYEKGAHLIPIIAKALRDVKIHVMGAGPLKQLIVRASRKYHNLIYHGYVPDDVKVEIVRRSSLAILPALYCETFGYSVIEALALGKPVVAFNLCGPKEIIESSKGGVLVRPFNLYDFINEVGGLLENPALLASMGRSGHSFVERLSPQAYANELRRVYEGVLSLNT